MLRQIEAKMSQKAPRLTNDSVTDLFRFYIDSCFKLPKEIKNDIIYCQRALKTHLKVHQMVLDVFEHEQDADPDRKNQILQEIEAEIYEINAEQNFLFQRLRRIVDEFELALKKHNIPMDDEAINFFIASEVVPFINDLGVKIVPIRVQYRNNEQKLIERYFEMKKENVTNENEIFNVQQDQRLVAVKTEKDDDVKPSKEDLEAYNATQPLEAMLRGAAHPDNVNATNFSQKSLLKPISQRVSRKFSYPDAAKYLQVDIVEDKKPIVVKEEPSIELPVSKKVIKSRLNLQKALQNAQIDKMAANMGTRTANSVVATVPPLVPIKIEPTATIKVEPQPRPARRSEMKTRATTRGTNAHLSQTSTISKERPYVEMNSSSEDSNSELVHRVPTGNMEPSDWRTKPEHYGQEMFLRIFHLYTPLVMSQMQQRRSKRKRRNAHSNERGDFHYGRIDYGSNPQPEKKSKKFLLSPEVKRGLQNKRPKRASAEKNEDAITPRSSTSSPDDKRCCKECLKGTGSLEQCTECKNYYHPTCHKKGDGVKQKQNFVMTKQLKLCSTCTIRRTSLAKKEALHTEAQELEKKFALEKSRRVNLLRESKIHKLQMNNILNIVNTIKSDQENDGSE